MLINVIQHFPESDFLYRMREREKVVREVFDIKGSNKAEAVDS